MHEPVTNAKHSAPGTVSTLVWCTGRAPSDIEVSACVEDMDARGAPPPEQLALHGHRLPTRRP